MSYDNSGILFWYSEPDKDDCFVSVCSVPNDEPDMCLTIYTTYRENQEPVCAGLSLDQVKKLRDILNDVIKRQTAKELSNILQDGTAAKDEEHGQDR